MTGPIEPLPPEVEALALRALSTRVATHLKLSKVELEAGYGPGDKRTFRSPLDGSKVGQVYRTDPDAEWRITDRAALLEHLATFPGNVVERLTVVGDESEVLAVLDEHAPHLLDVTTEVPEETVQAALAQSKATGEPAAPGIELVQPGGVLTVKPDTGAAKAIEGLVRAGWLTWDGQRALPVGEQREAS